MTDNSINKKLYPKCVITIYSDDNGTKYYRGSNYYLEKREINTVGGKFVLNAPVPLAADVLKNIAMTYMKKNNFNMDFGGLLAEHLLYGSNTPGKTIVMWYRPASKKRLNFSKALKIKDGCVVEIPAILYLVINDNLYLYALANNNRPVLNSKLYKAPFYNIYEDGNVCLGTAKVGKQKEKTFEKEAERFERAFYLAEQNGGNSSNHCKTPLGKLWPMLIKTGGSFPSKTELIQHKKFKTLSDLINNLIGIKQSNNEIFNDEDN